MADDPLSNSTTNNKVLVDLASTNSNYYYSIGSAD